MALTQISSKGIKDATLLNEDVNASADIAGSKLADNSISLAKLLHGDSNNNGKFLRANNGADPTFETVNTDLVSDTSPQLGGQLQSNGQHINLEDNDKVKLGTNGDTELYHNNTDAYIQNHTGDLNIENVGSNSDDITIKAKDNVSIRVQSNESAVECFGDGAVKLYHNNSVKIETTSNGAYIEGGTDVSMDASANGQLQIHGNGYSGSIALDASAMNIYTNSGSRAIKFGINEAEKVNIDTSGHLNIPNDSGRLRLGASADLQIYHQSGVSYIDDLVGAGDGVTVRGKNIRLQSNANVGAKSALNCNANAAVELFYNDVKQLETTENGILLPKGCIRGVGGSKVILGGTLDPSQDRTWNFSFGTNDNGYNQGFVFNIKFYVNHWNGGGYYKYIESISGGRGNTTGLERVNLINNLGSGSASWSNGHLDYSVTLSGGTRDGNNVSLFKVTYDSDGAPGYTSGYYLEVSYSNQIGTVTIT